MDAQKATTAITRMAELLDVSRSGYYAWQARRKAVPGPRAARRAELAAKIAAAHAASDGVYGAPRVTAELRAAGEVVSGKTVATLMRAAALRGVSPRPWRPLTTVIDPKPHRIPDRIARRFDQGRLDAVWTSDITYLATGQGWLYLCAVRDGCSRRVLGYAFADTLHTDLVESALRRAVAFRGRPVRGVILHADRGCQYTSDQLDRAARELGVLLSVGRTGVCWDNAQQESFWSTLKTEYYDRHQFATSAAAIHGVSTWIDTVYNRSRRHSSLDMLTPIAFEHQLQADQAA